MVNIIHDQISIITGAHMDEIWALAFNTWSLLNWALHEAVNFPGDIAWWFKLMYKVAAAILKQVCT